jgi:hypothetical protein
MSPGLPGRQNAGRRYPMNMHELFEVLKGEVMRDSISQRVQGLEKAIH